MTDDTPSRPRTVPVWLARLETDAILHPLPPVEFRRAILDATVAGANDARHRAP